MWCGKAEPPLAAERVGCEAGLEYRGGAGVSEWQRGQGGAGPGTGVATLAPVATGSHTLVGPVFSSVKWTLVIWAHLPGADPKLAVGKATRTGC